MTKARNLSLFTRFAAAFLAFVTVLAVMPALAFDTKAADIMPANTKYTYDFKDGTVGAAVSGTGVTATAMTYAQDPSDETNIVASGTNGAITFTEGVSALEDRRFVIETDIRIDSMESGKNVPLITIGGKVIASNFGTHTDSDTLIIARKIDDTKYDVRMKYVTSSGKGDFFASSGNPCELEFGKTYRIKLIVNEYKNTQYLYVDGVFERTTSIFDFSTVTGITLMSSANTWSGFVDNISYGINEYNEYISFDSFAADTALTSANLSALDTLTGKLSVTADDGRHTAVADPANSENIVAYNKDKSEFSITFPDDVRELHTADFVMSYDFRFSQLPTRTDKNPRFFVWLQNSNYVNLCSLNKDGYIVTNNDEVTDFKIELNKWTNIMCHFDCTSKIFDIYLDGQYLYSGSLSLPSDPANMTTSKLFVFNAGQSNSFKVYVDNIMLYESERKVAPTVIWDVDFDNATADNSMQYASDANGATNNWNNLSDAGYVNYIGDTWSYKVTADSATGNNYLLADKAKNSARIDLFAGNSEYNAGMNGKLSVKMDLTLEATGTQNTLLAWRRYNPTAFNTNSYVTATILTLTADGKLNFYGNILDTALTLGETYNIEVILDSVLYTVSLLIDGKVIYDSLPIKEKYDQATYSCFVDDAGITRVMPYTGYIKCFAYDKNGTKLTDTEGNPIYVDKFVVNKMTTNLNLHPDMLRLFAGVAGATTVFRVDNFKVERLESDTMFSTDFTGWEGKTIDGTTTDYRLRLSGPTVVNDGSDSYLQFSNSTGEQRFHIADKYSQYFGKSVKLSAELFLEEKAATSTVAGLVGIWNWQSVYANSTQDAGGVTKNTILSADGDGNIYDNMAISQGPIAQLNVGEPTKLDFVLVGDGENWIKWQLYIDGELKYEKNRTFTGIKTHAFVLYNIKNTVMTCDDVSVSLYEEAKALDVDFDQRYKTEIVINELDWNFGAFTYNTTNVPGDSGSKYLHIATSDTPAYADAMLSKFVDEDGYLIETSLRYSGSGDLNVIKLLNKYKNGSTLLAVKGEDNRLVVFVDGKEYDVKTTKDAVNATVASADTFTDIGVLVNGKTNTYTLYVDGKLAYYYPEGAEEKQPLANISFAADDSDVSYAFVRLFETNTTGATIDVDDVKLITLDNTLGSTIKGSQSKIVFNTNTYGVRFVAGVDTLYGTAVGFEVTANYVKDGESFTKKEEKRSSLVFDRIEADDKYVYASDLDCAYIAVISVMEIPMDQTVEFTVKPFIAHDTVKCYGEEYSITYQAAENLTTVALTEEVELKPLGRAGFVDGVLTADHAASGVALNLDCEGEVRFVIDTAENVNLAVTVDGVQKKNLLVKAGSWNVTVATGLEKAVHTIELVNESGFVAGSRVDIKSVCLNGELAEAPADKEFYIEFIGDSISAGYGLSANSAADPQYHDATLANPYLTAQILNTDYCITAKSGMGIAYGGSLFGDIYPYANVNRGDVAFVPERTPDLVVINLHTNDSFNWVSNDTDNFDAKFDGMVKTFTEQYGEDIPMLFVYGCMTSEANPGAYSVRATERSQYLLDNIYTAENGYNIKYVTLTTNREGLSSHPSVAGAATQANELAVYIKENFDAFSDTGRFTKMQSVLLMGQSNMVGRGQAEYVEAISDDRIFTLTEEGWVKMTEPCHGEDDGQVDLAASFAKAFVETFDCELGLIPAAKGGTSIYQWAKGYTGTTDPDLYETAVAKAKEAQKDSEICAILWHQGESNGNNISSASYAKLFKELMDNFINDLGLDKEKIVIITGELGEWTGKEVGNVNVALNSITTEGYYENYGVAQWEGLTNVERDGGDSHFDSPSLRVFGYRYFEQFYEAFADRECTYDYSQDPDDYRIEPKEDDTVQDVEGYISYLDFSNIECKDYTENTSFTSGLKFVATTTNPLTVAKVGTDIYATVNGNGSSSSYIDVPSVAEVGKTVVVELDLLVGEYVTFNSDAVLMKLINSSETESIHLIGVNGTRDGSNGEFYFYDPATGDKIADVPDFHEWTKIKIVCDMSSGDKTVYIDGTEYKLKLSADNTDYSEFSIATTRIGQFSKAITGPIYVDNYKFSYAE